MKLSLVASKQGILIDKGITHLNVCLDPIVKETNRKQKPNLIVYVLDVSGSMDMFKGYMQHTPQIQPHLDFSQQIAQTFGYVGNGYSGIKKPDAFGAINEKCLKTDYLDKQQLESHISKIELAKKSLFGSLQFLNDNDLVSIITFNTRAEIIQEPINTDLNGLNQIERKLKTVYACGGTNISDALLLADSVFDQYNNQDYNCKIIFLTDGEANSGITNSDGLNKIAFEIANKGITISTFGFGEDYNISLLESLANSGNGLFNHIGADTNLKALFLEELSITAQTIASNASLRIWTDSLVQISKNLNKFTEIERDDYKEVLLGDLYSKKNILFELSNDFEDSDFTVNVEFKYCNLENQEVKITEVIKFSIAKTKEDFNRLEVNEEVVKKVLQLKEQEAIMSSISSFDKEKNTVMAMDHLNTAKSSIQSLSNTYNVSYATSAIEQNEAMYSDSSLLGFSDTDALRSCYSNSSKLSKNI